LIIPFISFILFYLDGRLSIRVIHRPPRQAAGKLYLIEDIAHLLQGE
jgi:hypothetical protein